MLHIQPHKKIPAEAGKIRCEEQNKTSQVRSEQFLEGKILSSLTFLFCPFSILACQSHSSGKITEYREDIQQDAYIE